MRGKTWKLAAVTLGLGISAAAAVYAQTPGWNLTGEGWRYLSAEGQYQAAGWFQDTDRRWYHFDQNGIMQTGWFQDTNGVWYFLAPDTGAMQTGWHQDPDGKWYFLSYSGAMQTGLIKVDENVYFMEPSGALFTGDKEIGGTTYNFGLNGTTNGRPSVPATATYGGNGNQSLSDGGDSKKPGTSQVSKLKTAGTVEELNNYAKAGFTNLKYRTTAGGEVTLSEAGDVDYSKITLTVDAPNQTINNTVKFKQVTIEAVKPNTWKEYAGNKLILKSDARIVNDSEGTMVNVAKEGIQVRLEGSLTSLNITASGSSVIADTSVTATVSANAVLIVNDSANSSVNITEPVTVEIKSSDPDGQGALPITTTARATVKTAIPADITAKQAITLVITHSAAAREGVTVQSADSSSDASVTETKITNVSSVSNPKVEVGKSDGTKVPAKVESETKTTETSVKEGIKEAVAQANNSPYIGASINTDTDTITVTINQPGASLVNALPTARTILNIFKSVDGVEYISVNDEQVTNDEEMIRVAREVFHFDGSTKLENVKGNYEVQVEYKGGSAPLTYTVVIQ